MPTSIKAYKNPPEIKSIYKGQVRIMAPVDQSMSKVVRILETAAVLLSRSLCSSSLWLVQQKWFSESHWRPIISHSLFVGEAGCCRSCIKYIKSFSGASPIDELLFLKWLLMLLIIHFLILLAPTIAFEGRVSQVTHYMQDYFF